LSEKPAITTDSDKMDRGALDQLLLYTGTLGSIYHKNPETFIRNAVGKVLPDSPALNPHSRAVLISMPRPSLPSEPVVVRGPGPIELEAVNDGESTSSPPVPPKASEAVEEDSTDIMSPVDSQYETNYDSQDPYANLGGAFSNYLVDAPQPMSSAARQEEDLML